MDMERYIFKILRQDEWTEFEASGQFNGSSDDRRDGFIHLSSGDQVSGTLARHFSSPDGLGESGLRLLLIDTTELPPGLMWETSRAGVLFPHFYGALALSQVKQLAVLALDKTGQHILPKGFPKDLLDV